VGLLSDITRKELQQQACGITQQASKGDTMTRTATDFGTLCNYQTGEPIRPATEQERTDSDKAAEFDGGCGVIEVDGASCYVEA
jgi:hypothetical protein